MTEHDRYSSSELTLVRSVAAVFAGVGWWLILRGSDGFSGGRAGLERYLMEIRGEALPTQTELFGQFALGVSLFAIALALYIKAKQLRPKSAGV